MAIEIKNRFTSEVIFTFPGANLCSANLCSADLRSANLCSADLRSADLCSANLSGANLCSADLRSANLCSADLRDADLRDADLRSANLRDADLSGANLSGAKNMSPLAAARMSIVSEGDVIGYKQLANGVICKLRIPAEAKRSNATGRKCRAEFAIVIEGEGYSQHDEKFLYKVGETVRPTEPFCEDRFNECAPGIHFFLTREEAEAY